MIKSGAIADEDLLTAREAAEVLGTTPLMIARMARAGRFLGARHKGHLWYVPRAALALVATENEQPAWPTFPNGWYTIEEVAQITGRAKNSVYGWLRRGLIKSEDGELVAVQDSRRRWMISGTAVRRITLGQVTVGNKLGWTAKLGIDKRSGS